MSGIVGLWDFRENVNRLVLKKMSATLAHHGVDGEYFHFDSGLGLACQYMRLSPEEMPGKSTESGKSETQPVSDPRGVTLALDGRIFNRGELLSFLKPDVHENDSDSRIMIASYYKWGQSFAGKLKGEFAFALYDSKKRRLLLARDGVGYRPLYYHSSPRFFIFASEIKALLAHPEISTEPSIPGLAENLMGLVKHDFNLTCFQNIGALQPGFTSVIDEDGLRHFRTWDFDLSKKIRYKNFEDYKDAFRELFERGVHARMRSPFPTAVAVSGGLDSSSIFCTGQKLFLNGQLAARPLGFFYVGDPGTRSDELQYARSIEEKYGLNLRRIEMNPLLGITRGMTEQILHVEAPCIDYVWGVTREAYGTARREGARIMMTGHWGDQVLFPRAYLVDLARSLRLFEPFRHLKEFGKWYEGDDLGFYKNDFLRSLARSLTPPSVLYLYRAIRHLSSPPQFRDALYSDLFKGQLRQWVSPWEKMKFPSEHVRELYCEIRRKPTVQALDWNCKGSATFQLNFSFPMLDQDVLQFLMAIPGEILNWKGTPRALLREALSETLPEDIKNRRNKADFTDICNRGLNLDREKITEALGPRSQTLTRGLINPAELERQIAIVMKDEKRSEALLTWSLGDVYALETWLNVFFNEARPIPGQGVQNEKASCRQRQKEA